MKQKIYFISDVEMGRGDITDDFRDDDTFVQFLNNIESNEQNEKTKLVLNGDIFDFLKMCYKDKYPRYITKEISLWKLEECIKAHKTSFNALKSYLKNPNHSLFFVIGNHDADLIWPELQERIKNELNNTDNIEFGYTFQNNEIHAEHGHLQDPFFTKNTKNPIIKYKNDEILNLPWGAYACFSHLVDLKRKYPHEERLHPKTLALKQNKDFDKASKKNSWKLVFHSIFTKPITHFFDPTYKVPFWQFAKHLFNYGFEFVDDKKFLHKRIMEVLKANPKKQIIVLGHAHELADFKRKNQHAFVTDTWRNELEIKKNNSPKEKTYVKIEYHNNKLKNAQLKSLNI